MGKRVSSPSDAWHPRESSCRQGGPKSQLSLAVLFFSTEAPSPDAAAMVLVRLTKHPRGLAPRTVQKVIFRHTVHKESFRTIAK